MVSGAVTHQPMKRRAEARVIRLALLERGATVGLVVIRPVVTAEEAVRDNGKTAAVAPTRRQASLRILEMGDRCMETNVSFRLPAVPAVRPEIRRRDFPVRATAAAAAEHCVCLLRAWMPIS